MNNGQNNILDITGRLCQKFEKLFGSDGRYEIRRTYLNSSVNTEVRNGLKLLHSKDWSEIVVQIFARLGLG